MTFTRFSQPAVATAIALLFLATFQISVASGDDGDNETPEPVPVTLIGVSEIPGTWTDASGFTEPLSDGTPHNQLGGFSAIEYSPEEDIFYVLPDRGPKDGAVDYHCRFHKFQFLIDLNASSPIQTELVSTQLLRSIDDLHFTGLASAYSASDENAGRLDPEGIRIRSNGNIIVSDEYGPHVIEFTPEGQETGRYAIPERYLIENPGLDKADENGKNSSGRSCNRGMECLAITGNQFLYGLMQSPLLQDSVRTEEGKPTGLNCRILSLGTTASEMLYPLESASNKLNELLAIDEETFLVIERDGNIGVEAAFKKIMLIKTRNASDISDIESLPESGIPTGVTPVEKFVFIDLLDPKWNLAGENMPEKIEGLCFGPDLPDGRRTLFVMSDNDFEPSATRLFVFAIAENTFN